MQDENSKFKKRLGYIGLGKMGQNMVLRLLEKKYEVVVFDQDKNAINGVVEAGARRALSLEHLVSQLEAPRAIWIMVPYGAVEAVVKGVVAYLKPGDTVIDGGNSFYKDSMRRADTLKQKGVYFLDVGVSGGPQGGYDGSALMVGGEREVFERYDHLFKDLSAVQGYGYVGSSGAGHFVKMVHNGIEYGMMQSIAEGFAILKKSPFGLDLKEVARVFDHGSVVESRLLDWLEKAFKQHGENLNAVSGSVAQTGAGSWTVETAHEFGVDAPVIQKSVAFREESENKPSFSGKILSALRNQFGGHDADKKV